ncbi:hypothetical protein QUA41_17470 [Microcoleus sp. Pol11C1]|uniref:hypothetical protein n=1 Tax=unclassified Microcoleus TaxID=2642155 RepID=UPI002FD57D21
MAQPNQYDVVLGGNSPGPPLGSAILGIANRYSEPEHRQFCLDAAAAQLPVKHYDGRFYWSGPSAIVDDLQDVLGATKVKCVWDEVGSRFAVYPRAYSREAIALMRSLDEADILSIYFFVQAGRQPYKMLAENCLKTIHSELGLKVEILKAVTTEGVS